MPSRSCWRHWRTISSLLRTRSCPHRLCAFLAVWRWLCRLSPSRTAREAGLVGSALASFGRISPVQTVQFGGSSCYYADGWNGRGRYQCGNEWNDGFGWIGPFNLNTFGGSAIRRHHHGVVVSHPRALNPVYPRLEPPRRLGARGAPAFHTFGAAPGLHRFGAAGVPTSPNFRAGAATVSPGFAGGGFHGGLSGGNFHHFHGAGIPHIGAPASARFCGRRGLPGRRPFAWAGGATESTSARLPPQVLRALGLSIPAVASMGLAAGGPTSARSPHLVLPAAALTALERPEPSRAAARAFGQGGIGHR